MRTKFAVESELKQVTAQEEAAYETYKAEQQRVENQCDALKAGLNQMREAWSPLYTRKRQLEAMLLVLTENDSPVTADSPSA